MSVKKQENKNKKIFFKNMIKGYKKMGKINTELAQSDLYADNEALNIYEQRFMESEINVSKKRRYILR